MKEYQQRQADETEQMQFWDEIINKSPKVFIAHFNELSLMNQCKVKAFIQVRDSGLYSKLEKLLEDN